MNKILISLFISILTSCNNQNLKNKPSEKYSIINKDINKEYEKENKKETTDSIKHNFLDKQKTNNSPVKIISAKLLKNKYSDHKDIQLTYKNTSQKKIKAIKFEWYCEDAFDKPASGQFFFVKGVSRGKTVNLLNSKKTESKIWEDFSTDAHNIIAARAYYVVFADGSKWKLK